LLWSAASERFFGLEHASDAVKGENRKLTPLRRSGQLPGCCVHAKASARPNAAETLAQDGNEPPSGALRVSAAPRGERDRDSVKAHAARPIAHEARDAPTMMFC
jgi:hypothetical protein